MTKGVFLHRADSIYDDRPAEQYQFPKQYYSRAIQFIGDWIVYYEPVKAGRKGYYAIAKIEEITPDPTMSDMYLALIEPGSYLPFENSVPFNDESGLVERGLLNDAGKISGRAQAAVRPISLEDFDRILDLGFAEEDLVLPRVGDNQNLSSLSRLEEERPAFVPARPRDRINYLNNRVIRDRVFRKVVLDAYDCRCALTGLKFINGGGRAEVQAAHIRSVEHDGPDIISNGLALSGTAHWMFDRGLVSLSDSLDILVSRHVNDLDSVWQLMNRSRKAITPVSPSLRPHPAYLGWHREHVFKH